MSFRFQKGERLCAKMDIDQLFESASQSRYKSIAFRYFLRQSEPGEFPRQVLLVVPKRNIKLAVQRNRVKRKLREIYRLNKDLWEHSAHHSNKTLIVAVVYLGIPNLTYAEIERQYKEGVKKCIESVDRQMLNKN